MRKQKGQVIVIFSVLLVILLLILALLVDGARLVVTRQELGRAADAAGKAGLVLVGDLMVTQAWEARNEAEPGTSTPTPINGVPDASRTPDPPEEDLFQWLDDSDRLTLVAPPVQTAVTERVREQAAVNDAGLSDPRIEAVEVEFPYRYHLEDEQIYLLVRIVRRAAVLFGSFAAEEERILTGESKQTIPQR